VNVWTACGRGSYAWGKYRAYREQRGDWAVWHLGEKFKFVGRVELFSEAMGMAVKHSKAAV
jgi:hypothetical protein